MLGRGDLAGGLRLDLDGARAAIEKLGQDLGLGVEETAAGIVSVAAAAMAQAVVAITIERGEDPREAALMAFGGAGPLFGCLLARELGVTTVVVPNAAGNFSAWGLLCEDVVRSSARTFIRPLTDDSLAEVNAAFGPLFGDLDAGAGESGGGSFLEPALDLRFMGQEHTITLAPDATDGKVTESAEALAGRFGEEHERLYGHRHELPVEVVNLRATMRASLPQIALDAAPAAGKVGTPETVEAYSFDRGEVMPFELVPRASLQLGETLDGPAVVVEETTVTYVDHGFRVEVHPTGTLFIKQIGA
jgi:N-methylhydantoinase A